MSDRTLCHATLFVFGLICLTSVASSGQSIAAEGKNVQRRPNGGFDERSDLPQRALLRLGTDHLRTRDFIQQIAFSPDGRFIAAVPANSPRPIVPIFDVHSGRLAKQLTIPDATSGYGNCMTYSADGTMLLCGEVTGHITLWRLQDGQVLHRHKLHEGGVNAVAISPDGKTMATGGEDGIVHVLQVAQPNKVDRLSPARDDGAEEGRKRPLPSIQSVAYTPDSSNLVVGASDATVAILGVDNLELVQRISTTAASSGGGWNPSLQSVAVTPDGRKLLTAGQQTVPREKTKMKYGAKNVPLTHIHLWDLESGKQLKALHDDEDSGFGYAALSRDGNLLATADFSKLTIRNVGTGKVMQSIPLPGSWGNRPVFSPDSTIVALAISNTVALFDVENGRRLHHDETTPNGGVASVAWSRTGNRLVTGHEDGYIRMWEFASGKMLWRLLLAPVISPSGWNASPAFVGFSDDGKTVVAAGRRDDPVEWRNGIVVKIDATSGERVNEIFFDEIRNAALAPDGNMLIVSTSHGSIGDTRLHGIDMNTGKMLYTSPPEDVKQALWSSEAMSFGLDSSTLHLATGDSNVLRFNASTGDERDRFRADWRTPDQIKANKPSWAQLWEGAFSDDCKWLVTSSAEHVYVWDVGTTKLHRKIRHPHDHGCTVAVSTNGQMFATSDLQYAGDYGEDLIRLYDIHSGEEVMKLDPGDNRAGVMAFSPDGTKLFTGFHRGSAVVWDVQRK